MFTQVQTHKLNRMTHSLTLKLNRTTHSLKQTTLQTKDKTKQEEVREKDRPASHSKASTHFTKTEKTEGRAFGRPSTKLEVAGWNSAGRTSG